MKKSVLYSCIALALFTLCFTFPVLGFHGVSEKIKNDETDKISGFVYPMWNLYQTGRYTSSTLPKDAVGNLKKMVDTHAEIGVASMPIWYVSLEAPNYPKEAFPDGIPVYFHLDGYSGDVHEMNTINHYIGMFPMEHGGQLERKVVPYLLLVITLMLIWFNFINNKWASALMIPTIVMPIGFIADYSIWLYWFGHNMQNFGAFTIKPFMPTVFGDGKVAQFTTHSYPTMGFFMLLIIAVLSLLAVMSKTKELRS
jgi:hypothetical protein